MRSAAPKTGFMVVNAAGEISAPMTAWTFVNRDEAGIGFWRIRAKAKMQQTTECVAGLDPLPSSQRGGALSTSTPRASLASPFSDSITGAAEEPSVETRRVAQPAQAGRKEPEPAERINAAGSGDLFVFPPLGDLPIGKAIESFKPLQVTSARDVSTEALPPKLSVRLGDRVPLEGSKVSSGRTVSAELPESNSNRARKAVATVEPAERGMSAPQVAEKPKPRDWITERRERLAGSISFLKTQGIAVQTHNRDADIKEYLVSSRWGEKHLAEEVIELAIEKGWSE